MSQYYLSAEINGERVRVILDSTSGIDENMTGTLNKFVFENGDQGADNYVNNSNKISFTGTLSDIKSISSVLVTEDTSEDGSLSESGARNVNQVGVFDNEKVYLKAAKNKQVLEQIKTRKISVLVKVPNREVYDNCYITSLVFSQSSRNGVTTSTSGELTSSYGVKVSFEQVRIGARAVQTIVRSEELEDSYIEEQKQIAKLLQTKAEEKKVADDAAAEELRKNEQQRRKAEVFSRNSLLTDLLFN
jgi:hypothetical protein